MKKWMILFQAGALYAFAFLVALNNNCVIMNLELYSTFLSSLYRE
ncbi:hypothetical protein SAB1888c [Staphylococcus aureus RF122]|nr:hypothetical protein SAB1888c [Staphylococcus aureus RF122]